MRCPVCGLDAGAPPVPSPIQVLEDSLLDKELGGFVLSKAIGRGARGAVFLASPAGADEGGAPVAVKTLLHDRSRPAVQEHLLDSARKALGVRHPNLAALVSVGVEPGMGVAYLVSEYVPGEDLAKRVAGAGVMPPDEAARIGAEVAHALGALHDAGALHRDIRPSHIVVDDSGTARLVEAGFAPVTSVGSDYGETTSEPIVGSPDYLAPEQARDVDDAVPASDLYALGASIFHLVAGRPPFVADSPMGLLVQHATRKAPRLGDLVEGVPEELSAVVERLLAKDPDARPGAAGAAAALDAIASGGPSGQRPGPRPALPLSRAWLGREATLAAALVERGVTTAEEIDAALNARGNSGAPLASAILARGIDGETLGRVLREVELAEKRHVDATFGRLAMEAGLAGRKDIEQILLETGASWRSLDEALVRAGVMSEESAASVRKRCARHLREEEARPLERLVRAEGVDAGAVSQARFELDGLPAEDGRSLLNLLVAAEDTTLEVAWKIATESIRTAVAKAAGAP
jgi:hypothetical protein